MKWVAVAGIVVGAAGLLDGAGLIDLDGLFAPMVLLLAAVAIAVQVEERREVEHGR